MCYNGTVSITSYQRCCDLGEYRTYVVPSKSDPDKRYEVIVIDPDDPEQSLCDCEGFAYRGVCHHIVDTHANLCHWNSLDSEIEQTREQKREKICPVCAGPTEWKMG
jgi:hypothetical protein